MPSNKFWHMRNIEPKRKFRWVANVGNGEVVQQYVIQKVAKPEWSTTEKEHKILGHSFWYPGPVVWNTVDVTFIDIAGTEADSNEGNASVFLYNAVQAAGYVLPSGLSNATSAGVTKARSAAALGKLEVMQLDSAGKVTEKYSFHNPWIQKVVFGGDLDYSADDFMTCTITCRYDWAMIGDGPTITAPTDPITNMQIESFGLTNKEFAWGKRPKNSD